MSQNTQIILSSVSRLTHANTFHTETFSELQFISQLPRPIYNPLFASLSCQSIHGRKRHSSWRQGCVSDCFGPMTADSSITRIYDHYLF